MGPLPLPVTVGGTVTITNQPNVFVTNSAANPVPTRDVDNPARQPFQQDQVISIHAGTFGGDATFTVPKGKRLVIEFVSIHVSYPTGQKPTFAFLQVETANSNKFPNNHNFVLTFQAPDLNSDVFAGASPTRLYADPGTTVTLSLRRNSSIGEGLGSMSVSGYLVDL